MAAPPDSPPSPHQSRPGDDWFFAGLASSFPNITNSSEPYFKLVWPQPSKAAGSKDTNTTIKVPGCKIFHPKAATNATTATQPSETAAPAPAATTTAEEIDVDAAAGEDAWLMREQVLVFRYKGVFHAVDHACPHRAYSLSWGVPFDIEDAGSGRTLGHAIRCRGHSFAFELTTGAGDRGGYQLGVWDVELRPAAGVVAGGVVDGGDNDEEEEREVWVRRRGGRKQGPGQDHRHVTRTSSIGSVV